MPLIVYLIMAKKRKEIFLLYFWFNIIFNIYKTFHY